ncbi:hypothetical protein AC249_AIPGENE4829 [Exaiptasia diaphana]|nr:hypothetical protein AC249_AIPGENE4829 [Exaiptasia diaphana]
MSIIELTQFRSMPKRRSYSKKSKKTLVKPQSRNVFFRAFVRVAQTLGCCILPQEEDGSKSLLGLPVIKQASARWRLEKPT